MALDTNSFAGTNQTTSPDPLAEITVGGSKVVTSGTAAFKGQAKTSTQSADFNYVGNPNVLAGKK